MFATGSPSDLAQHVDNALLFLVVVCLVLLVGITSTMIFFLVKYRRSKVRRTKQIHTNCISVRGSLYTSNIHTSYTRTSDQAVIVHAYCSA